MPAVAAANHQGRKVKSESSRVRARIKALERRADHLAKRIAESDIDLSYDRQELGALRWALEHLRDIYKDTLKEERT